MFKLSNAEVIKVNDDDDEELFDIRCVRKQVPGVSTKDRPEATVVYTELPSAANPMAPAAASKREVRYPTRLDLKRASANAQLSSASAGLLSSHARCFCTVRRS